MAASSPRQQPPPAAAGRALSKPSTRRNSLARGPSPASATAGISTCRSSARPRGSPAGCTSTSTAAAPSGACHLLLSILCRLTVSLQLKRVIACSVSPRFYPFEMEHLNFQGWADANDIVVVFPYLNGWSERNVSGTTGQQRGGCYDGCAGPSRRQASDRFPPQKQSISLTQSAAAHRRPDGRGVRAAHGLADDDRAADDCWARRPLKMNPDF